MKLCTLIKQIQDEGDAQYEPYSCGLENDRNIFSKGRTACLMLKTFVFYMWCNMLSEKTRAVDYNLWHLYFGAEDFYELVFSNLYHHNNTPTFTSY